MHQSTTPSLLQTIWRRRAVPHPPYCQDLAPSDFWLFPKLSLWDNWGDESGSDEGHWHAHTRGLPWGLLEVFGTVKQVHCSRRRLLRRGLEFHVYTINESAHTKHIQWSSYYYLLGLVCKPPFLLFIPYQILHHCKPMVSHWSLNVSKSPQSPGLFSVFWTISIML